MGILLDRGQHGLIVGQNGSGKTRGAVYMLRASPLAPVIVLDTKVDVDDSGRPIFDGIARDGESIDVIEDRWSLKRFKKSMPDYLVIRPDVSEANDPESLDGYLMDIYTRKKPALVYLDETYQFHHGGRAGPGLVGLLTRGRALGISTLMGAQRPSWISRFCLTEAKKFYIYRLGDRRDRKTLAEVIPEFDSLPIANDYKFWYYDTRMSGAQLFKPFPLVELNFNHNIGWV